MTYAVHTATCTYLLDEDGICRWTESHPGAAPPGVERCVGAQFVACLDLYSEGGLVGELRVGASALLAREEDGRFVLLRTLPIVDVEIRDAGTAGTEAEGYGEMPSFPPEWEAPPPVAPPAPPLQPFPMGQHPPERPVFDPLTEPFPAYPPINVEETAVLDPQWSTPEEDSAEQLDLEDLLSISVTEVTLSLPLYRPPLPRAPLPPARPPPSPSTPPAASPPGAPPGRAPPHAPPRRNVVGPGRRLR